MKSIKGRIQAVIIIVCLLVNLISFHVQASVQESSNLSYQQKFDSLSPLPPAPDSIDYTTAISSSSFESYYAYLQYKINYQLGITSALTSEDLKTKLSDTNFKQDLAHLSFISMYGVSTLNSFADSDERKNFLTWLFENVDAMNTFMQGGAPRNDKVLKALSIWEEIWRTDSESHSGIYLTLAMATSLDHADSVDTGWYQVDAKGKATVIDPISRYNNYKTAHKAGKLYPVFDTLDVWHMRLVVDAWLTDADLDWARKTYARPHSIVSEKGETRNFTKIYSRSNITDAGHELQYNMTNASGVSVQKGTLAYYGANATMETVLKVGGVCGAIAKYGTSVSQSYGVPAMPLAQPGHAAAIYNKADGVWALHNDIFGFGESLTHGGIIIPWNAAVQGQYVDSQGNASTRSFGPAYMLLFEDAYKNPSNISQSEHLRLLANEIKTPEISKAIRNIAIEVCPKNIQVWREHITALKQDSSTIGEEWNKLNSKVISNFANHPRPMTELLISIEDKVLAGASEENKSSYVNSLFNAYEGITDPQQVQIRDTIEKSMKSWMFTYILKPTITFSFDGDNANKLMGFKKGMSFSIDGGKKFLSPTDQDYKLSISELNSLTLENKIWVRNKYSKDITQDKMTIIDIRANTSSDTNVSSNDIANTIIGIDNTMEFSINNGQSWTKYNGSNLPSLSGNIAIKIRKFGTDTTMSGPSKEVLFANPLTNDMAGKKSGVTYISDIKWEPESTNGYGAIKIDTSTDNNNIKIGGITYTKGIGSHANAKIIYNLNGKYTRFVTDVGTDNENNGTIQFKVIVDGIELYDSGFMNKISGIKHVDVSVAGKSKLELVVNDEGNGNGGDHADWAGAYLISSDIGERTVPSAPTAVSATAGNAQATLTFTVPIDNGGSVITSYTVTTTFGGITLTGTGASSPITVTKLTNGTTYTFTVTATNAIGTGVESSISNSVTPSAPYVPPTPTPEPVVIDKFTGDVTDGTKNTAISQIVIQRATDSNGVKVDKVAYEEEKARETVQELKEEGKDTARIVILDAKDEVAEVEVKIPTTTFINKRPVDIVIPLKDINVPTESKQREKFLNKLVVCIEHSDGERVVVKGEIVQYKKGVLGLKFRISKVSTFTIINLNKDEAEDNTNGFGHVKTFTQDKEIQITFNNILDQRTITKDNIYVEDSKGNKVETILKYNATTKSVTVIPVKYYNVGESYNLYVKDKVILTSGKPLEHEVNYKFNIENRVINK